MNPVLFSSARVGWRTPEHILDLVRAVAPIRHDPCTHWLNPTRAQTFHAPSPVPLSGGWLGPCGLAGAWPTDGLLWGQPPFGRFLGGKVNPDREVWGTDKKTQHPILLGKGVGWAERFTQHTGPSILLVPSRTDAKWWRQLWRWSDVCCFYEGRILFLDEVTGEPAEHGATFPCSFLMYGGSVGRDEPGFDRQDERDARWRYISVFQRIFGRVGALAVKP